jgi:hypothetical protein
MWAVIPDLKYVSKAQELGEKMNLLPYGRLPAVCVEPLAYKCRYIAAEVRRIGTEIERAMRWDGRL